MPSTAPSAASSRSAGPAPSTTGPAPSTTGPALATALLLVAGACGPAPDDGSSAAGAAERGTQRPEGAAADSVRRSAVVATVRGFKEALAAGDSVAALAHLHPDAVVHESGYAETRAEYRAGHLGADMEFLGQMETETTRQEVVLGARQALYLSEYRMEGAPGGDSLRLWGVETMVLVPAEGASGEAGDGAAEGEDDRTAAVDGAPGTGWRIRHIHWSSREPAGG